MVYESVRPEICRVALAVLFRPQGDRGLVPKGHPGERVFIEQIVGHGRNTAGRVLKLGRTEHQHVAGNAEIIQGVAPAFLGLRQSVDITFEEEHLGPALVPASVGGEHVVLLVPEIDIGSEPGFLRCGIIFESRGLDEHGIGEHVDVPLEEELLVGVVVPSVVTLDYLSVLAPHRRPAREHGDAVLGVVVEDFRPQYVLLLVAQLHDGAAELREVVVYQIVELLAREFGFALDQPHVPDAMYDAAVHIPHRAVADKIGSVMQEGRAHGLAHEPVLLRLLLFDELRAYETDQRIRLLGAGPSRQRTAGRQKQRGGKNQSSFLTFPAHPFREKSQSPNRGSMTMYVESILSSRNLSMASICFIWTTRFSSSV